MKFIFVSGSSNLTTTNDREQLFQHLHRVGLDTTLCKDIFAMCPAFKSSDINLFLQMFFEDILSSWWTFYRRDKIGEKWVWERTVKRELENIVHKSLGDRYCHSVPVLWHSFLLKNPSWNPSWQNTMLSTSSRVRIVQMFPKLLKTLFIYFWQFVAMLLPESKETRSLSTVAVWCVIKSLPSP